MSIKKLFDKTEISTDKRCLYRNEIYCNPEIFGTENCDLCLKGQIVETLMTIVSHLDEINDTLSSGLGVMGPIACEIQGICEAIKEEMGINREII